MYISVVLSVTRYLTVSWYHLMLRSSIGQMRVPKQFSSYRFCFIANNIVQGLFGSSLSRAWLKFLTYAQFNNR